MLRSVNATLTGKRGVKNERGGYKKGGITAWERGVKREWGSRDWERGVKREWGVG